MSLRRVLTCTLLAIAIIMIPLSFGQTSNQTDVWKPLSYLVGDWIGDGGGSPGIGSGWFTFSRDLQNAVMIRKNHTNFPASKTRPAFSHDDLMVIYADAATGLKADYYDNEGHTLHYSLVSTVDTNQVVFITDKSDVMPRFRLTYTKKDEKSLSLLFEMASPGKPEDFKKYIEASAHRK